MWTVCLFWSPQRNLTSLNRDTVTRTTRSEAEIKVCAQSSRSKFSSVKCQHGEFTQVKSYDVAITSATSRSHTNKGAGFGKKTKTNKQNNNNKKKQIKRCWQPGLRSDTGSSPAYRTPRSCPGCPPSAGTATAPSAGMLLLTCSDAGSV